MDSRRGRSRSRSSREIRPEGLSAVMVNMERFPASVIGYEYANDFGKITFNKGFGARKQGNVVPEPRATKGGCGIKRGEVRSDGKYDGNNIPFLNAVFAEYLGVKGGYAFRNRLDGVFAAGSAARSIQASEDFHRWPS